MGVDLIELGFLLRANKNIKRYEVVMVAQVCEYITKMELSTLKG